MDDETWMKFIQKAAGTLADPHMPAELRCMEVYHMMRDAGAEIPTFHQQLKELGINLKDVILSKESND